MSKPIVQTVHQRTATIGVGHALLAVPFDTLRFQYAGAVVAGMTPRSLLASAHSERAIDLLERIMLGPMARQR